jgi:hypothetical protein
LVIAVTTGLRTGEFARVFRDTTSSYKFFWLLAIIDLLPEFHRPVPEGRLVRAMITRAWATVVLFRLSLGKVDRLQDCVLAFQKHSGLPARTSPARLAHNLEAWPMLPAWVDELVRFVPGRFLGSWFQDASRTTPYDRRGSRALAAVADQAWGGPDSGPYRLIESPDGGLIELAPGWLEWLETNQALLLGFAERELTRYLQARNPNVPAIVNKLELPRRRSLRTARAWWTDVISQHGETFIVDIFSGQKLGREFEIDHFLPWSFVAHDEFWNLCPVEPGLNRSKSDRLPAIDLYLPRLAALHGRVISGAVLPHGLAQSYGNALGVDVEKLRGLSADWVARRYEQLVTPLAQIAANQGLSANRRSAADRDRPRPFTAEGGG